MFNMTQCNDPGFDVLPIEAHQNTHRYEVIAELANRGNG